MNRKFLLSTCMAIISLDAMQQNSVVKNITPKKQSDVVAKAWRDNNFLHTIQTSQPSCQADGLPQVIAIQLDEEAQFCRMKRRCKDNANVLTTVDMQCGKGTLLEKFEAIRFLPRKESAAWGFKCRDGQGKCLEIFGPNEFRDTIDLVALHGLKWPHNGSLVAINNSFCVMGVKKMNQDKNAQHFYMFKTNFEKDKNLKDKPPVLEFLADLGQFEHADCADISDDGSIVVMAEHDGTLNYFRLKI